MCKRWWLFIGGLAITAAWNPLAHGADKLLAEVRTRNRAAVEAIHTFSCRYRLVQFKPDGNLAPRQDPAGEYWRSAGIYRWKWENGKQSSDAVIRDGREVGLFTSPDDKGASSTRGNITPANGLSFGTSDPWLCSMVTFLGDVEKPGFYTFDEMLSLPSGPRVLSAERRSEQGVEMIVVTTSWNGVSTNEFWFDPGVNYLVRKMHSVTTGKPSHDYTAEVTRFHEAAQGIFFPAEVKTRRLVDGQLKSTETYTLSDINVNQPLADSTFELRFPAGIEVADQIQGVEYVTGPDGSPANQATPIRGLPPPPTGIVPRTETKEEPQSPWSRIILIVSVSALACAGVLWAIRRYRDEVA